MNDVTVEIGATSDIVADFLWRMIAWGLDLARMLGVSTFLTVILGVLALTLGAAKLMQWYLNRTLSKKPEAGVSIGRMEFWFSLPGLVVLPFYLVGLAGRHLRDKARAAQARRQQAAKKGGTTLADLKTLAETPAQDKTEDEAQKAVLAATLGPTFFLAGLITFGLYVLTRIAEPLFAAGMGLSRGYPAWQYLLLGSRPELGWYMPLERYPYLAALVAFLAWMVVWVWVGRFVRLSFSRTLGQNLLARIDEATVLPWWRNWFGADRLFRPAAGYLQWAKWLPIIAFVLLGWAWAMAGGTPYRTGSSALAVALILWLSWVIHLVLQGKHVPLPGEPTETASGEATANGWLQVLEELEKRHQAAEPYPFEPPRLLNPLHFVQREAEGIVSPLLRELLPKPHQMTFMQHEVLETLSKQAFVHVEPPLPPGRLTLGAGEASGQEDRSGQRHRNQVVLAPEGFGKTTLGMLAACNHALGHTQSTLVIVRNADHADALHQRFQATLRHTTLRWNLRVRKVGPDLASDMAQGILPDVVVTGLDALVTVILDQPEVFESFLKQVGLIVIDDIEAFAGPVEVHAQLALRRLGNRYRNLMDIEALGDKGGPQVLVLGAESMHDPATWARTLCGIDAVSRRFGFSDEESHQREAARNLTKGIAAGEVTAQVAADGNLEGPHQRFYRLADFRTATSERLDLGELIATCERMAVPWHYRPANDARRQLGRNALLLQDEPLNFAADPADACVVFLAGEWSETRRECIRLRRAGTRFSRVRDNKGAPILGSAGLATGAEPIAIITVNDPDQDMAFTHRDPQGSLTTELKTLPRPILRPPEGDVPLAHLTSDLVRTWNEVGDLVQTFGTRSVQVLRTLAEKDMLLADPRTDISQEVSEYKPLLFVRAMAKAVDQPEAGGDPTDKPFLPPKVVQVEQVAARRVHLRDRTSMMSLGQTDAQGADNRYYLGRVFSDARGRFVVVGRASQSMGHSFGQGDSSDILVEPILADDVSSPRWRHTITELAPDGALATIPRALVEGAFFGPEPMLIGEHSIDVGLRAVQISVDHVATYRLGPIFLEPRQRTVFERSKREAKQAPPLMTAALVLRPNPTSGSGQSGQEDRVPRLTLEQARVLAASMRAVLPSMYRGAGDDLGVALDIKDADLSPGRELRKDEGFVLFDLDEGGNGTARSIHRDGVELLLRLCRAMLERVLYHDRLRALHDHWGDEAEILAGRDPVQSAATTRDQGEGGIEIEAEESPPDPAALEGSGRREEDRRVRKGTLVWLDSHLRPEGGGGSQAVVGNYGSDVEAGEGDVFDIGRCWYSQDASVTDLLWTKHRWRLADGGDASLDVAFDRKTAEQSRHFTQNDDVLAQYFLVYDAHLQVASFKLPDNTIWGAPRVVWYEKPPEMAPEPSRQGLPNDDRIKAYHAYLTAIAAHTWPALEPLARALRETWWQLWCQEHGDGTLDTGNTEQRNGLATFVSRFVQGIPFSVPTATRLELRPPVSTLLYRLGDCDSKSLLLALLLKHCKIEAGLFVSFDEGHAMCAAGLPDGVTVSPTGTSEHFRDEQGRFTSEDNAAKPDAEVHHHNKAAMVQIQSQVARWRQARKLEEAVPIWAEQAETPLLPMGRVVYVPIESTAAWDPGRSAARQPDSWVFLPLSAIWMRFETERSVLRTDNSETESSLS